MWRHSLKRDDVMDTLVKDEENFSTQGHIGRNQTQQEICETKTLVHLVTEAIHGPFIIAFWTYLVAHLLVLFYFILYKWNYERIMDLIYYAHRIRKYIGCLGGVFSFFLSWRVINSTESCPSAIYLVVLSFILCALSAVFAYGWKGKSSVLLSILVCGCSIWIILYSVRNHFNTKEGQDFTPQSVYGILHLALGIKLLYMSKSSTEDEIPWRFRNGMPHQMEEIVIHN